MPARPCRIAPPADLEPEVARVVEALARMIWRQDNPGELIDEWDDDAAPGGDLRPILKRPAERP